MKLRLRAEHGEDVDGGAVELRAARVAAVRGTSWPELEQSHLVPRGPIGWVVHEPSDALYVFKRGDVFAPGRGVVEFADPADANLAYYVTARGELVVLERVQDPRSWSEHVARQARQKARAKL